VSASTVIDGAARATFNAPPLLPAGSFFQTDAGDVLVVRADGGLDQLVRAGQPWHRSAAADPSPGRRTP
jgi:hypothetical protein